MPQGELHAASLRFVGNEIGDLMSEVVAYGTAVTVKPPSLPRQAPSLKRQPFTTTQQH